LTFGFFSCFTAFIVIFISFPIITLTTIFLNILSQICCYNYILSTFPIIIYKGDKKHSPDFWCV
jgi:hypothetical protein